MKKKQLIYILLLSFLFSSFMYATTIDVRVSSNEDDAEEYISSGNIDLGSTDLELVFEGGSEQAVGVRFLDINIPNGATITDAYIQFAVDEVSSGTANVIISGQAHDNAPVFLSDNSNITNRTKTSASVTWNIPDWGTEHDSGLNQRTPDLTSIIQEIVSRAGWNSNNEMVFIITKSTCSDCRRIAESHNGSNSLAPLLHIEYSLGQTPPIMNAIPNQTATEDEVFNFSTSAYVTQTNGDSILSYALLGNLPDGLFFNTTTGDLVGTPTESGTFPLEVNATDDDGTSSPATFDLIVSPAPNTCTDYDSSNHGNPGRIITSMDQITASKKRCITGASNNSESSANKKDYYLFTVKTEGTLEITTNSPNYEEYYLRVGSTYQGTEYYGEGVAQKHNVPIIALSSGDTIYVHVKETGDENDQYEIHFNFTSANPAPIANAGFDQYIEVGEDVTLDASGSTDDGNIIHYAWSTGDTGISPTISGLAIGIYTITLTVTDNEGSTGTDTVTIAVSGPGNDAPVIVSNGGGDSTSLTVTSSETHVTTVHAIDPDGDTITYSISGGANSADFVINESTGGLSLSSLGTPGDSYVVEVTATDPSGAEDTQTITVVIDDPLVKNVGDRPFTVRNPPNTRNIRGNYVIGGNINLCEDDGTGRCRTDNNNDNDNDDIYINIDGDPNTLNSSSFDLNLPADANILWAGLYWQGVVHRSRPEDGGDDFMGGTVPSNAPRLGGATNQIDLTDNTYGAEIVKFKIAGATEYINIVANQLDYSKLGYSGFTNVTSYIDPINFNGTYTLADLKCHEGAEPNHGNYGGWALVVIYSQSDEDFKNITLFDGFATVDGSYNDSLVIEGFLTPKNPPIESKIAFFTMDGEGGSNYLRVISNKIGGSGTKISGTNNPPDSLFNSTIQGVTNRYPLVPSLRMDLDIIDLVDVLQPSESGATLEPRTNTDRYTPSFFIMSSDLIAPELCYDYDIHVGDAKIASEDRHFDAATRGANLPLQINVLIRSKVADFDFEQAKSYITFRPDANITEDNAKPLYDMGSSEVSPAGINAYLPVLEINGSTRGLIGIGHDIYENQENENGGTINPNESTYYKQKFNFTDDRFQGRFDIHIEGYVDYLQDGNPFYFPLSTRDSSISRCSTNQTYDAVEGNFNIENALAANSAPSYDRYPLYTQVTGKEYEIVLASYTKDANDDFTVPTNSNMTLDIELIDAGVFDNNSTIGYDSTCEKPPTTPVSIGFIKFNNQDRLLFNPSDYSLYDNTVAIKNAAFRMWILTKKDSNSTKRIMVEHGCTSPENYGCFEPLYDTVYKNLEDNGTKYCTDLCNPALRTQDSQCYDCLKKYFAVPICSRDNFSIRPEAFSIEIGDNNNDVGIISSNPPPETEWYANNFSTNTAANQSLAAGYKYPLEVNATIYQNQLTRAKRYHSEASNLFEKNIYANGNLPNIHSYLALAALEFKDDTTNCANTDHTALELRFTAGQLDGDHFLKFGNVGKYAFAVSDSAWTEVDQARFPYKTDFGNGKHNECDINSFGLSNAINTQVGCTISSTWGNKSDMNLTFRPTKFDLNANPFTRPNTAHNYLYMNNLESANVNDQMAIKMEGNITARGADNSLLSNFTGGCAGEDVRIWLDRTMVPNESSIVDEKTRKVNFQQAIKADDGILVVNNNALGNDINSTLGKVNFKNTIDSNGSANLNLYFNFAKPYDTPVNPVDVNFTLLHVDSINAQSNAYMETSHVPEGNATDSAPPFSRYFIFAKVAPKLGDEYISTFDSNHTTYLRINTFCKTALGINCAVLQGLGVLGTNEENINGGIDGAWYRASTHNSATDGNVTSLTGNVPGISELPLATVTFDSNGSTGDITLTYPIGNHRPKDVVLTITPDEWLKYKKDDITGLPTFSIHYRSQGLRWKGAGDTGHVIKVEPNSGENKRMNW